MGHRLASIGVQKTLLPAFFASGHSLFPGGLLCFGQGRFWTILRTTKVKPAQDVLLPLCEGDEAAPQSLCLCARTNANDMVYHRSDVSSSGAIGGQGHRIRNSQVKVKVTSSPIQYSYLVVQGPANPPIARIAARTNANSLAASALYFCTLNWSKTSSKAVLKAGQSIFLTSRRVYPNLVGKACGALEERERNERDLWTKMDLT